MKYAFLMTEMKVELNSPHLVYRAVRAICRLHQENELSLTERQRKLGQQLEYALRDYAERGGIEMTYRPFLPIEAGRGFVEQILKEKEAEAC